MHCIQNTVKITILLYINSIPLCCKVSYVLFYCNTFHPRGRRHVATSSPICVWTFQSTPPAKAETVCVVIQRVPALISIHSTREGGDETYSVTKNGSTISIHSTREGGDGATLIAYIIGEDFNPLHPRRRRPKARKEKLIILEISIHSTREGGDKQHTRHHP